MDNQNSQQEAPRQPQLTDGAGQILTTADGNIPSVNWTNTPLFKNYVPNQENSLKPSKDLYLEQTVDDLLEKLKVDPNNHRKKEELEQYHTKASSSLKILMDEQSVDSSKYEKIKEMYKEITYETTMKLLIRCRMAFDTRAKVLELFDAIETYQAQYEELRDIIIRAAGDDDALSVQQIYCDKSKLNEINNVSKVIKQSAQNVLKKADDLRKKEEKGERGSYTVLFKNEDLIERVLGEVKHIKTLLDKCKIKEINKDLNSRQKFNDIDSTDQERITRVQFEVQNNDAEVRKVSNKSNRKNSKQKAKKGSVTPSGRGSNMSNMSGKSNRSYGTSQIHTTYQEQQLMQMNGVETFDMYQQRMNKQQHQMFNTAHEGGFYQQQTDRSMSKKKKKSKRRKGRNVSNNTFNQSNQVTYATISDSTGPSYTPMGSVKPPSMYGVKNVTLMKNPLQFANTGQNFYNHEKLKDNSMNMTNAMKRKIHLPSDMRRQQTIYDLNGRPIYRNISGTAESNSKSPRLNPNQHDEFLSYPPSSKYHTKVLADQIRSPTEMIQQKKGSPINMRTEYSGAMSFQKKRGSHMIPKQSNFNIQKDPVKVLNTQLSTISKQNVLRDGSQKSSTPPLKMQTLPDIKPPSRGIDQMQKIKRPEAASEKAHIFNPRARSTIRNPQTKVTSNSGLGFNTIQQPDGLRMINKSSINKNSQPEVSTNKDGNNTQRIDTQPNFSRKLSPLEKLNTERGVTSFQTPFGIRKGSMAVASSSNINKANDKDSNLDLSLMSQKQHKWPSPGRSSHVEHYRHEGALASLYENPMANHFTSTYSSVWLKGKEGMYKDNSIGSDLQKRKRESNSMLFHMERAKEKMEKMQIRATKDALCQHYLEHYGILPTEQQKFFLDPMRLRKLLIKMATDVTQNAAASRLQNWYRGRLRRLNFFKFLRATIAATKKIQKFFRKYRFLVILPRELKKRQEKLAFFIQQCLRGYQARRLMLKEKAKQQIDNHYAYWHTIDLVRKGHFQRRVRRAWLAYKARKAEKKRKADEAAAAKKAKLGGRKRKTMAAPPAQPATNLAKTATSPTVTAPAAAATGKKSTDSSSPTLKPRKESMTVTPSKAKELASTMGAPSGDSVAANNNSEMFDNENATKENEDVQMVDDDVMNINVNPGDGQNDENRADLDVINEEDLKSKSEGEDQGEKPEGQADGDQADAAEGDGGDMDRAEAADEEDEDNTIEIQ